MVIYFAIKGFISYKLELRKVTHCFLPYQKENRHTARMDRLQMTIITHCFRNTSLFVVFSTRSLGMLETNPREDCFKNWPFSQSRNDFPAPRKQADQHHQSVDDGCPLETYSPPGPQSKLRSRLSL